MSDNHPPVPKGERFYFDGQNWLFHVRRYLNSDAWQLISRKDLDRFVIRDCANEAIELARTSEVPEQYIVAGRPLYENREAWQKQWRSWRDGREWR